MEDNKAANVPKVIVFVANGSEEIETVCVIDILRRTEYKVSVLKIPNGPEDKELICKMSRGVLLVNIQ